jgi:SRSO17 transposase
MSAKLVAPGAQQKRFAAYLDRLAQAAGHADRAVPLKSYCTGLLLDGERKSVEPMAARIAPGKVRQTHQSLHHFVADALWSDEDLLEAVRSYLREFSYGSYPAVLFVELPFYNIARQAATKALR